MKKRHDPEIERVKASWAILIAVAVIIYVAAAL